jgi:amino acid permease
MFLSYVLLSFCRGRIYPTRVILLIFSNRFDKSNPYLTLATKTYHLLHITLHCLSYPLNAIHYTSRYDSRDTRYTLCFVLFCLCVTRRQVVFSFSLFLYLSQGLSRFQTSSHPCRDDTGNSNYYYT